MGKSWKNLTYCKTFVMSEEIKSLEFSILSKIQKCKKNIENDVLNSVISISNTEKMQNLLQLFHSFQNLGTDASMHTLHVLTIYKNRKGHFF